MAEILICKEVYSRDIYFAISEQRYHLTSTDSGAVDVRSVNALVISQEEADSRIILHCMHIQLLSKFIIDSDFSHNYLHTPYLFEFL